MTDSPSRSTPLRASSSTTTETSRDGHEDRTGDARCLEKPLQRDFHDVARRFLEAAD